MAFEVLYHSFRHLQHILLGLQLEKMVGTLALLLDQSLEEVICFLQSRIFSVKILSLEQVDRRTPCRHWQRYCGHPPFLWNNSDESGWSSLMGSRERSAKRLCWLLLGGGNGKKVVQEVVTREMGRQLEV